MSWAIFNPIPRKSRHVKSHLFIFVWHHRNSASHLFIWRTSWAIFNPFLGNHVIQNNIYSYSYDITGTALQICLFDVSHTTSCFQFILFVHSDVEQGSRNEHFWLSKTSLGRQFSEGNEYCGEQIHKASNIVGNKFTRQRILWGTNSQGSVHKQRLLKEDQGHPAWIRTRIHLITTSPAPYDWKKSAGHMGDYPSVAIIICTAYIPGPNRPIMRAAI